MAGIAAFGTTLSRRTADSPVTYTALAELTSISGPSLEAEQIDVTSHDSADMFEEFVSGIKRGGTVDVEGNFMPGEATHQALLDDFNSGDIVEYELAFPISPEVAWTFDALVVSFSTDAPFDGKLSFSASFKLSGPVDRGS
jgi:predicted secreted protein